MTNETSLVADTVFCPHITFEKDNKEVMRITADKIVVAPGVSVDAAAKCVIECLEKHIASVFSQKDLEIKNLKMALKPFAGLTNSEEYIKNGPYYCILRIRPYTFYPPLFLYFSLRYFIYRIYLLYPSPYLTLYLFHHLPHLPYIHRPVILPYVSS